MKKRMSAMICVLVLLSMLTVFTVACNKDGFKINFYDGDSIVTSISTKGKEAITLPTDPVKAGYAFEGWFFEEEFINQLLSTTYEKTKLKAEVNVYAKWTANDNTVSFNANTGAGEMASIVAKTDAVVKLTANAFAKDGYTFAGWALSADGLVAYADGADFKMTASGATLYAVWTANDNTVIFNANGGVGEMSNQTIKSDATLALTSNTFTKDGYTFAGWALSADGAVVYNDGANYTMSTSGATLYAVWTANDNTVTFYANYGTTDKESQTIKTNVTATLRLNTFVNTGYTFAGWATTATGAVVYTDGADFKMTASDATLYAVWTANDNTVTFYANYGTTDKESQTIKTNVTATLRLNTFANTGYTFAGWATTADGAVVYADGANYTMGTAGVTLYAVWTANDNTVTFYANYGTTDKESQTIKTNVTATLRLNTFVNTGYTFAGWATTADGAVVYNDGANYKMGTASVTLYAVWTANDNTVTFNAKGGAGTMANQTIKSDATLALTPNAFTKTGYTFAGWATTADGAVVYADGANYTMGTASVTLYAVWTANDNTVTFNANTGAGTMANQTIKSDATLALTPNAFTKTGYTFAGWATTADGAVVYADGANYTIGTASVTLYAVWTINTYTINFNYDGAGSDTSIQTMQTTYGAALKCPMPRKTDYVFQGWYDGTTQITDNLGVSIVTLTGKNDKVFNLKAKWALQTEDMEFSADGKTLTKYKGAAQYVVIPDTVTSIGDEAFRACRVIKSITIPASVTRIGRCAFFICSGLTSITVAEGNTRYKSVSDCLVDTTTNALILGCNNSVIPDGVTSIGLGAFYGCSGLKAVTIPASVKTIDDLAFSHCTTLASVVFEKGSTLTSIGESAFYGSCIKEFTLPASVTNLDVNGNITGISPFKKSNIEKFIVEDGNPIFYVDGNCLINGNTQTLIAGCKDSRIPNGVTSIGNCAFFEIELTSITIPNRVTSIGNNAFFRCRVLESITIGSGVKSIDYGAFEGCFKLTSITVAEGNTTYKSAGNCLIERATNTLILGCNNSVIPDGVTSIGKAAFYGYGGLKEVIIPSTVTSIGDSAFSACQGLTSIAIPDSVTSIGEYAFFNCTGLTSITIGSGVTSIGEGAFQGCYKLTTITIPATVTTIGANAFNRCSKLATINCEATAQPAGWDANWKGNCTATVNWGYTGV